MQSVRLEDYKYFGKGSRAKILIYNISVKK